jgi:predicted nucleic acid-binding protein
MNRQRGITFDTGALIALERKRLAMDRVYATAQRHNVPITVLTVVIAEWWRAGAGRRFRELLLASVLVEDLTKRVASLAGEFLGRVRGVKPDKGTIDAIVLTSAWLRGDVIYTSDVDDFRAIQASAMEFGKVVIERV